MSVIQRQYEAAFVGCHIHVTAVCINDRSVSYSVPVVIDVDPVEAVSFGVLVGYLDAEAVDAIIEGSCLDIEFWPHTANVSQQCPCFPC